MTIDILNVLVASGVLASAGYRADVAIGAGGQGEDRPEKEPDALRQYLMPD